MPVQERYSDPRAHSGDYPPDWDDRREAVYARDGYVCQQCGAGGGPRGDAELHAHHRRPLSKGGTHRLDNLVTLCKSCHERLHGHSIPTGSRGRQPPIADQEDADPAAVGGIVIGFGALVILILVVSSISKVGTTLYYTLAMAAMVVAVAVGGYTTASARGDDPIEQAVQYGGGAGIALGALWGLGLVLRGNPLGIAVFFAIALVARSGYLD